MSDLDDWKSVILNYFGILQMAVQLAKVLSKIRKSLPKEYGVDEIKGNLQSGELHFGDKIKVLGTFSEYIPFLDPKFILEEAKSLPRALPRTARLDIVDDVYCGALLKLDQTNAFAEEVLPIFYGLDSKMQEHSTGEMLEIKCQIVQVPIQYRNVINQNDYFIFEKEDGLVIPFGLKVLNVEPYGLVDSFKINAWLVGNLEPAPFYKKRKERICFNCANFFSYMTIEPVDYPPKIGCISYAEPTSDAKGEIRGSTENFLKLEKDAIPYVVFPKVFRLFEVFYPLVDIFNDSQREHSKNVILGSIEENMERLIQFGIFEGFETPKESTLSVDFQYDQLNKITQQTFDATDVPKWECPHYEPTPKYLKELAKLGKKAEEEEKFKVRKHF